MRKKINPIHPGKILLEEFMIPYKISQNKLGTDLNVSPRRINEIVNGKRSITADTALRLAHYFQMSPQFWLGLQTDYDLASKEDSDGKEIKTEVKIYKAA